MKTFREFWPFYLSQHRNPVCRWLHFTGTTVGILFVIAAVQWQQLSFIIAALVAGYGFAWVGHFAFERNKPATFRFPIKSFLCDLLMYGLMWKGLFRRNSEDRLI